MRTLLALTLMMSRMAHACVLPLTAVEDPPREPTRAKLVIAILEGNVEAPQRDDFIYLKLLAAYLVAPVGSSSIRTDVTVDEVRATMSKMARAHAAFGVDAHVALRKRERKLLGLPKPRLTTGKSIKLSRIIGLVEGPLMALPILLELLSQDFRKVPVSARRSDDRIPALTYERLSEKARKRLWQDLDAYFGHGGDEPRRLRLENWGARLTTLLASPRVRLATEEHRRFVMANHRALGARWRAVRSRESYQGNLGRKLFEAAREEFGSAPEDRVFMIFVQSLLAMYHGCPYPER